MKGGCCKTTTARNVGFLLARDYKKRVLLVDLDSSGNLSNSFGVRPEKGDQTGVSAILRDKSLDPMTQMSESRIPGLFILPGNKVLGKVELEIKLDMMNPQQYRLRRQLDKIESNFDYCFIDCPPTIENSILVINALTASDEIIIPTTPNLDSLDGISSVLEMVDGIADFNPRLAVRGIILNRIARNAFCKNLLEQEFSCPRFKTHIREAIAAEYCLMEGKAFCEENKRSKPSLDYDNFVAELLGVPFPHPEEII